MKSINSVNEIKLNPITGVSEIFSRPGVYGFRVSWQSSDGWRGTECFRSRKAAEEFISRAPFIDNAEASAAGHELQDAYKGR